jgi:hypothetical protein
MNEPSSPAAATPRQKFTDIQAIMLHSVTLNGLQWQEMQRAFAEIDAELQKAEQMPAANADLNNATPSWPGP